MMLRWNWFLSGKEENSTKVGSLALKYFWDLQTFWVKRAKLQELKFWKLHIDDVYRWNFPPTFICTLSPGSNRVFIVG